jgi:putrescine aminotransferase
MAAARAAVEAIENDGLVQRSATIGAGLLDGMRQAVQLHCPHLVRDVRGIGLLIGVEAEDPGIAGELLAELMNQHVIVNYSLNAPTVLRFTPPAVMTAEDTEFLLSAFAAACAEVSARYPTASYLGGS